jgi:hypothetical protein
LMVIRLMGLDSASSVKDREVSARVLLLK